MTLRHMQTAAAEKPGAGRHSCHSCFVYARIEIVVYSLTTAGASTTNHRQASSSRLDKPRKTVPLSIVPTIASKIRQRRTSSAGSCVKTGGCAAPSASRLFWFPPCSLILLVSFSRPFNNVLYVPPSFFSRSPHSAQLRNLSIRPAGTLRADRSNSSDT